MSPYELSDVSRYNTTRIGTKTFTGTSRSPPEQLNLFDALNIPKPALKQPVVAIAAMLTLQYQLLIRFAVELGGDDLIVGFEDRDGEAVGAQVGPDVLDGVQFGGMRRQ